MDFSNLEVTGNFNRSTFWTFGRKVIRAQTNQVDLNEFGSRGIAGSICINDFYKEFCIGQETLGGGGWNAL